MCPMKKPGFSKGAGKSLLLEFALDLYNLCLSNGKEGGG